MNFNNETWVYTLTIKRSWVENANVIVHMLYCTDTETRWIHYGLSSYDVQTLTTTAISWKSLDRHSDSVTLSVCTATGTAFSICNTAETVSSDTDQQSWKVISFL